MPDHSYVGWIPTANGRLSFRHIGETRHPTPSKYANVATNTDRIIVAYQRRNLSDSVFRTITDRVSSRNGDFWFALSARSTAAPSDIEGNVRGQVHIYKTKEDWRSGPEKTVRKAIDELNEARLSLAANRNQTLNAAFKWADDALKESSDITLDFEIIRDGELRVSIPRFSDQDLAFASRAFAEQDGYDFDKWIADQAYFFIRDIAHQHQHHDEAVDTILILQKKDDDDVAWRRNIIFSLHFYIISARRTRDVRAMMQTVGVFAYCQSFTSICQRRLGVRFNEIPSFQEHALKDSLNAAIEEQKYLEEQRCRKDDRVTNFRVMTLAVIAPTLALIGVAIQPHIGGDDNERRFPALNAIANFIAENAMELCGLTVLALLISWTVNSTLSSLKRDRPGRQILSLGIVDERWAFVWSVVAAITCLSFGAYFGQNALKDIIDVFSFLKPH